MTLCSGRAGDQFSIIATICGEHCSPMHRAISLMIMQFYITRASKCHLLMPVASLLCLLCWRNAFGRKWSGADSPFRWRVWSRLLGVKLGRSCAAAIGTGAPGQCLSFSAASCCSLQPACSKNVSRKEICIRACGECRSVETCAALWSTSCSIPLCSSS